MAKSLKGTIELMDDYVITVDMYNYSVGKRYTWKNKDGEVEHGVSYLGHHNTLPQALESFRRYLVRERLQDGSRTLSEALRTILEVNEQAMNFIRDNIPEV